MTLVITAVISFGVGSLATLFLMSGDDQPEEANPFKVEKYEPQETWKEWYISQG